MQPLSSPSMHIESIPGIVILDPPMSGPRNMEIDEALLEKARPDWPVVLRIYQWEQPTLSIGHFQQIDERLSSPGLAKLPWVRRRTGGGAIVHDQELTYCIVFPNRDGQPSKGHSEALYRAIHLQFVEALGKLGLAAKLSEACTCKLQKEQKSEPFLCFSRRSPVDLLVGNDKIMGSAQRRSTAGLLQHGSFLLHRSGFAPQLSGLLDITESSACAADYEAWQNFFIATLKGGVERLLQVRWRNGKLSELLNPADG
jgi:lipoate-protein ligase A